MYKFKYWEKQKQKIRQEKMTKIYVLIKTKKQNGVEMKGNEEILVLIIGILSVGAISGCCCVYASTWAYFIQSISNLTSKVK